MEAEILDTLRAGTGSFVSGEQMSRMSGVSRTAIWKEIQKLREEGYRILAQPHAGYQLVGIPDRMIPQELTWNLETQRIGKKVHAYETTDSTMEIARRLSAAGEPEGSVVIAEGQGKGRGRLGRSWVSPKGKGIYLSVILRPKVQFSRVPLITLMTAVAVARAISKETTLSPEIKWPNDVLIKGKKVSGILTEMNAELNRVNDLVVGIGLNVNTPAASLPAHATSLSREMGHRVDRLALARSLLVQMDRVYLQFLKEGVEPILAAWRGHALFLGKRIRVAAEGRTVDGQAMDVDSSGALLVRTDAGMIESVSAGEVLVVR